MTALNAKTFNAALLNTDSSQITNTIMKTNLIPNRLKWIILGWCLTGATSYIVAQSSYTITTTIADAMLSSNSPTLNFGAAGTLAIAPASASKGAFDSVLMFNTASAVSQFDTTYGAGNWMITGLTLSLAGNYGTNGAKPSSSILNTVSGGNFSIDWIANNSWVEGTGGGNGAANGAVSFNSIPSLLGAGHDSLGTYTYTPPGNNIFAGYSLSLDAGLVSGAAAGGAVSLFFYAADNQVSYLFNSREYTASPNSPQLTLTVAPTPEPTAVSLLALSLGGCLFWRQRTRRTCVIRRHLSSPPPPRSFTA
jgi:hypothetical protein